MSADFSICHLVLTGTDDEGDFVLEGDVRNVVVESKLEDPVYHDLLSIKSSATTYHGSMEFVPDEDSISFRITRPVKQVKTVLRTARVEATDRTAAAIEAARVACGAPTGAKFKLERDARFREYELVIEDLDSPNPIAVEFRWQEEVNV